MGIKAKAWRRVAVAVAVPGATIGALAGFGVSAAGANTTQPHPVYQPETITGSSHSPSGNVPIQADGAFSDFGTVNLNGPENGVTGLRFGRGTLYVSYRQQHASQDVNPYSCQATETVTDTYQVTGGTGRYDGAQGSGVATVRFSAVLPRRHNHTCDTSDDAQPLPGTTSTTFEAHGPIALRH